MGKILIISVLVFLVIILLLVWMLLFARKKLLPQGEVTLTINDEKELTVQPGSTLLNTLSDNKIYLPSACGGGGTCGLCKCQITEGGGEVLPTEKPHLSRKEQKEDVHLSCQV
nr:2Fe-2S iron-sulfur cluster binding domain-containing protein [Bacteroidales bacterium]